jgi:all-trans-retinol dehydrogenase (NAD+)
MKFEKKLVLITGGASGIGKIMARLFLQRNAVVVLWDINSALLKNSVADLVPIGNVYGNVVDISDPESITVAANRLKVEHGVPDILINNAGIVIGKYFHEHVTTDILKTMDVNASAPMLVANAFLKEMMDRNSGSICTIASSAGLISNPKMSVYAASKWAAVGWSDSLRLELNQLNKNIQVATIMPYYINTGMFDGVQSRLPILDPEVAAHTIVKAIEKGKKLVTLPGYIYRVTRLGQALMPMKMFDWFVGSVLGIYKTMEHFIGRK